MRINADFGQRVVVKYQENQWVPSPMAGVERKMLDRIGDEVARATTIVRYAPGSSFSAHTHDGGEEYIVLEGVFQDEHGDFPIGSYVRNPPTSSHTPAAEQGAIIFVKLHQFDPQDRTQVHEQIRSDIEVQPLFSDEVETVQVESWKPNSRKEIAVPGGMELLVLEGSVSESDDQLEKWDWLRLPPGSRLVAEAGTNGAKVWTKSGHLNEIAKD